MNIRILQALGVDEAVAIVGDGLRVIYFYDDPNEHEVKKVEDLTRYHKQEEDDPHVICLHEREEWAPAEEEFDMEYEEYFHRMSVQSISELLRTYDLDGYLQGRFSPIGVYKASKREMIRVATMEEGESFPYERVTPDIFISVFGSTEYVDVEDYYDEDIDEDDLEWEFKFKDEDGKEFEEDLILLCYYVNVNGEKSAQLFSLL